MRDSFIYLFIFRYLYILKKKGTKIDHPHHNHELFIVDDLYVVFFDIMSFFLKKLYEMKDIIPPTMKRENLIINYCIVVQTMSERKISNWYGIKIIDRKIPLPIYIYREAGFKKKKKKKSGKVIRYFILRINRTVTIDGVYISRHRLTGRNIICKWY